MQTCSLTKLVSLTLGSETAGASDGTPLFQAQHKAHVALPVTGQQKQLFLIARSRTSKSAAGWPGNVTY